MKDRSETDKVKRNSKVWSKDHDKSETIETPIERYVKFTRSFPDFLSGWKRTLYKKKNRRACQAWMGRRESKSEARQVKKGCVPKLCAYLRPTRGKPGYRPVRHAISILHMKELHFWPMHAAQMRLSQPSREIAGKTHTCWFDWGRAGERAEVGIRSSCTELSPICRKQGDPSLLLCVREIDTSGGGRFLLSSVFVYFFVDLPKEKRERTTFMGEG